MSSFYSENSIQYHNSFNRDKIGGAGVVVVRESGSTMKSLSSFLLILILLAALGVGLYFGYKYFFGYTVGTEQILEKNKAYLVAVTNKPDSAQPCDSTKNTFGMNDSGVFFIDKGCSGVFVFTPDGIKKKIGVCTTNDVNYKRCDTTKMSPDTSPFQVKSTGPATDPLYTLPTLDDVPNYNSLTGFIDMTDSNIAILQQNGNCRAGSYGFYGNNMISVKDGCKGVFVVGPLVGKCESSGQGVETKCPIGSLDFNGQGLVLNDIKPYDTSNFCARGDKSGFKDVNMAFRDPSACPTGGVTFGSYTVKCDDKSDSCPLNPNTTVIS
jgi:hypothetical protein